MATMAWYSDWCDSNGAIVDIKIIKRNKVKNEKDFVFLMCLCCSMMFFACGQDDSESTGTGDSTQIEQESDETSSDSSDDTSSDKSDDSSGSSDKNDGIWTPPAKQ